MVENRARRTVGQLVLGPVNASVGDLACAVYRAAYLQPITGQERFATLPFFGQCPADRPYKSMHYRAVTGNNGVRYP